MPPESDVSSDEPVIEPKVRRVSNKSPRKSADPAPSHRESAAKVVLETETAPKSDQKRSNRRRRGKGKSTQKESESSITQESPVVEETIALATETPHAAPAHKEQLEAPRDRPQENRPQPQKPRRKLDPQQVAKNAWKIFLAEVSEEGIALIGDNDARELARRCFRLSEIFLEEADKRG